MNRRFSGRFEVEMTHRGVKDVSESCGLNWGPTASLTETGETSRGAGLEGGGGVGQGSGLGHGEFGYLLKIQVRMS